MTHIHWVARGTGIPKDRDVPSKLRVIRKDEALVRIFPTLDLRIEEKGARRKWNIPRSVDGS